MEPDDVVAFQDRDEGTDWLILAPNDDSMDSWVRCPASDVWEVRP